MENRCGREARGVRGKVEKYAVGVFGQPVRRAPTRYASKANVRERTRKRAQQRTPTQLIVSAPIGEGSIYRIHTKTAKNNNTR